MQKWKNPISISPLQLNYSAMTIQRMSCPMPDDLAQVENTWISDHSPHSLWVIKEIISSLTLLLANELIISSEFKSINPEWNGVHTSSLSLCVEEPHLTYYRIVCSKEWWSMITPHYYQQEPHVTHFRIPSYLHSPISPRWTERIESSGFLKVETTNSLTFYSWDNQVSIDSDLVFGNQMCTIQRIYSQN